MITCKEGANKLREAGATGFFIVGDDGIKREVSGEEFCKDIKKDNIGNINTYNDISKHRQKFKCYNLSWNESSEAVSVLKHIKQLIG